MTNVEVPSDAPATAELNEDTRALLEFVLVDLCHYSKQLVTLENSRVRVLTKVLVHDYCVSSLAELEDFYTSVGGGMHEILKTCLAGAGFLAAGTPQSLFWSHRGDSAVAASAVLKCSRLAGMRESTPRSQLCTGSVQQLAQRFQRYRRQPRRQAMRRAQLTRNQTQRTIRSAAPALLAVMTKATEYPPRVAARQ